jgi:hypothetical protein
MTERDRRIELVNTLLTTPHRDLASLLLFHKENCEQDPRFYVHLAAWYADRGQVRDHKEMFVINLCLSQFEGHREVGLALLRRLPPYEVARIVDFIKGYTVRHVTRKQIPTPHTTYSPGLISPDGEPPSPPPAPPSSRWLSRMAAFIRPGETPKGRKTERPPQVSRPPVEWEIKEQRERVGMFRNIPRSMRTEIERYLREREANPAAFDRVVLTARKSIKRLYAGLHIQPGPRAQAILFSSSPPQDSLAYVLRQIRAAETPAEKARAISQHRIPFRVAISVIQEVTPTILAALIDVMTPQEVINNLAALRKRGALDNPDLKSLVNAKLEAAKTDKRVSAYKAKVAADAADASGELAEMLDEITETQVRAAGQITRPTALLIDKSGSMDVAIEVGRQLGAMISTICKAELHTYAFDTAAYPVEAKGPALADWEKALLGINAGGATSCGVAVDWMCRKDLRVEQIVMVTDEGENHAPLFEQAYREYREKMKVSPAVILIKVGNATAQLEQACTRLGVAPQVFEFQGDYYALPNVIPLLTYPSMGEMVMEILDYPLPKRKIL